VVIAIIALLLAILLPPLELTTYDFGLLANMSQ